jgi:hypothetical protein
MTLAIIGFVLVAIAATKFLLHSNVKKSSFNDDISNPLVAPFLENATKYEVSFDDCQFKDASFLTEEEQKNEALIGAGLLVGSTAGLYYTPVKRVENVRAVLFFQKADFINCKRFIQTFPIEMKTLKYHVLTGSMKLFVDKENPDKYVFLLEPETD